MTQYDVRIQQRKVNLPFQKKIITTILIKHKVEKRFQYIQSIQSSEKHLNKVSNEDLYKVPDDDQILQVKVSKLNITDTLCQTSNHEWTPWSSSFLANGNDFETLYDHRRKYGLVEDLSLLICLFTQIFLEFVIHRHTFKRGKRRHRYLGLKVNRFLFMTQN